MERDFDFGYGTYTFDADKFYEDLKKFSDRNLLGIKRFDVMVKDEIVLNFYDIYSLQTQRMTAEGVKDLNSIDDRVEEFADCFNFYFEKFTGKKWKDLAFHTEYDDISFSYSITDSYEDFLKETMGKKSECVKPVSKFNDNGEISW